MLGRIRNELDIMCALNGHPNIVQLYDVFELGDNLFLVLELCIGGTVLDIIRASAPVCEAKAALIFRGMCKAVLHCHQVGAAAPPGHTVLRI